MTWDMLPLRLGHGLVVSGSVRLLLGAGNDDSPMRRHMSTLFSPPLLMISNSFNDTMPLARSYLAHELPPNVAIMTFQPLDDDYVLLRLAHLYAVGEMLGQPVNVSLSDLFLPGDAGTVKVMFFLIDEISAEFLSFLEVNEVSLTTNQPATFPPRNPLWRRPASEPDLSLLSQVFFPSSQRLDAANY